MTAKVKAIKNLYQHGKLTIKQLYDSVPAIITEAEYQEITGKSFR